MANTTVENLPKMQVKITVTVSPEEMKPFLDQAANDISNEVKVKGFRPGKAPYDVVAKQVGEMAVWERSIEPVVRRFYTQAVLDNDLETVGAPDINVTKIAPGSPIEFEATVSLMPAVKKLADWKKLKVKKNPIAVTDKEVNQALDDLTRIQTKEVRAKADTAVGDNDKVVVDLDMKKDGVPVEGGSSKGSFVYMGQDSYLPGLKEALKGMKEGEKKDFEITFPKDHFQKHLADQKVQVTADVKEIFNLEPPTVDDEFAKGLGLESKKELMDKLNENIGKEKEVEEGRRLEQAVLEEVAKKSDFDELPESLVSEELSKMVHELKHNVEDQGLDFNQYLNSLGKTAEELSNEMKPQAELRLKVALILKAVAKAENVEIPDEELDKEIDKIGEVYKENKEAKERIYSPEFREYHTAVLRNRKVIAMLKDTMAE